jgi:hypothetical protein
VQAQEGRGTLTVRGPRLPLAGDELALVKRIYTEAIALRPKL